MPTLTDLTAENAWDVAWIVAMWKAIHGGDPGPDGSVQVQVSETTALLGGLFLASLAETTNTTRLKDDALQNALENVGVKRAESHEFCNGTVVCVTPAEVRDIPRGTPFVGTRVVGGVVEVCYCIRQFPPGEDGP